MPVFKSKDAQLAVGLSWAQLSGEAIRAEALSLMSDLKKTRGSEMNYGFVRSIEDEEGRSFHQMALGADERLKGLYSAAAILADYYGNVVYAQEMAGQLIWVCAISENQVLVGGDECVSKGDADDYISEMLSRFGDDSSVRVVLHPDLALDSIDTGDRLSFDDLMDEAGVSSIRRAHQDYKIGQPYQSTLKAPMYALVVAVIGVSAYIFGPFGETPEPEIIDMPDMPSESRAGAQDSVAGAIEERRRKSAEERAKDEELSWIVSATEAYPANLIVEKLFTRSESVPKLTGGWSLNRATYSSSDPGAMRITYQRQRSGSPLSLRKTFGPEAQIEFSQNANFGTILFTEIDQQEPNFEGGEALTRYRQSRRVQEALMHDLIGLNVNWSISDYEVGPRPSPLPSIVRAPSSESRLIPLGLKSYNISANDRNSLLAASEILTNSDGFSVREVRINFNEGFAWTILGEMYEIKGL